jgi:hypothetical protein
MDVRFIRKHSRAKARNTRLSYFQKEVVKKKGNEKKHDFTYRLRKRAVPSITSILRRS